MYFNAMPEGYKAIERSKIACALGILCGCLTLVFAGVAVFVKRDYWVFSLLSFLIGFLCMHYSKSMRKDSAIKVHFSGNNIEICDDKGRIIKAIDYEKVNCFEDKCLNVSVSISTRSGNVICKEQFVLIYFGRVTEFGDLSIGRPRHSDAYYLELFYADDCIVVPYHAEIMEILRRKCS